MSSALDSAFSTSGSTDPDVTAYVAVMRASGRRDATLKQYRIVLGQWSRHLQKSVLDATKADAYGYLEALQETGAKPGGIASRVRVLKAFYAWCVREEMVPRNPWTGITITVPEEIRLTPDEEAIDAMLASAKASRDSKRDTALLLTLIDTGARKSEVANVSFEDVDLHSGTLTFRVSKSRARTVPMSDRLMVAMTRWGRQRGTAKGNLWGGTPSLVRHLVHVHSKGVYTPHCLRRAFAVRWLERGGSESGLMRIAGWSTSDMVRVYTRAMADRLAHDEFRRLVA